MNDSRKSRVSFPRFERYAWLLAVVWTVLVATSLVWNVVQINQNTLEVARIQARVAYEKDLIYRQWNAGYGGVYVPVTEESQVNPYLSHISDRDIITPSGKLLTLMNPAYMTRQVHELAKKKYGLHGHITSLNPIRPENTPDPWEKEALQAFNGGQGEISSVEEMEDGKYMRLMRPLITEKDCLKCHAVQGYQEGDIRGGISVSIPMESLKTVARKSMLSFGLGHVLLWLMCLGGIVLAAQRLMQRESARRLAEEELEKTNMQLEHANIRLKELDHLKFMFIASMSHELRTPLNSIIGLTGIILQGISGDITEVQGKELTMVKNSANHLLALINDVIDVSKIEAEQVELAIKELDLADLIQEVKDSFKVASDKKGIKLSIETPERLIIKSDERRTKQVVMNLVSNAIKFTDKGKIAIKSAKKDEGVEILVADTGIGIKEEDIKMLFKQFSRIHVEGRTRVEGTGLGLYLSKKIADLLGGEISVESEFGKGSKFTFILPLKYKEANP